MNRSARIKILPNNIYVVETSLGDILVNCPPETLKYLLAQGIKPPAIILLPPDVPPGTQLGSSGFVHKGINYASVEFLVYSNFFGQNGAQATIVTVTANQAQRLHCILSETTSGPGDDAAYGNDVWLKHECAAVAHFPPLGRAPTADDMVVLQSLDTGGGDFGVLQITLEDGAFVFREHGSIIAHVATEINEIAEPLTLAPPRPLSRQELTLQFIGGSDGFDPLGITTCFLAYLDPSVQTQATLFDAAAYLCVRLGNLGLSPSQVSAVVISHLHEDHLAGLPELVLMGSHRVRLITADIIYQSLLRVLSAMLALPADDIAALFDHYPLNPGQPLELDGLRFEATYAVHSIPTIAVRVNSLCYSGDMRYDEEWFTELEAQGVLAPVRRAELVAFAEGASVLVQDAGGGAIHSTITPELLEALTAKSQHLILAHTSKHLLPLERPDLTERVEFAESGHVVALGNKLPDESAVEPVETLSACPLFVRLTVAERIVLASQISITSWADGDIVVEEGDASDGCAYVVHSGLLEVVIGDQTVRVLGRGNSIGERGAILGDPRTSTMVARGALQLLRLRPTTFQAVASRLGLVDAFARADWLWQQTVFRDMPWANLLDLALEFSVQHLDTGEQFFAFGEPGYEGYLLVDGSVVLRNADGVLIEEMTTPGEFFGIRAAIYGKLRSASAYTNRPTQVWCLPASALRRLYTLYPNLLMHLRAVETSRLRERIRQAQQ